MLVIWFCFIYCNCAVLSSISTHGYLSSFHIKFISTDKIHFHAPKFISTDAASLDPMIFTLYNIENDIYQCTIYPNQTDISYQCTENNTVHYKLHQQLNHVSLLADYDPNFDTNVRMSVQYNSANRLLIDSITLYGKTKHSNNYYVINQFCVPWQYQHLGHSIAERRLLRCKHSPINTEKNMKYNDIAIGGTSNITHHIVNLISDWRAFPNKTMEAIITPPPPKQFGVHVAPIQKLFSNPQTKDKVTLTLHWYDKMYECDIYPTEIDTDYLCNIGDPNVSSSYINSHNFGQYLLKMEKEEHSTDAVAINRVIVRDITNTSYIIRDFCASEQTQRTAQFCHYEHMKHQCDGYLGGNLGYANGNEYLKCTYTCIDSNGCGGNSLLFYFTENLYTLNNEYLMARINSGVDNSIISVPMIHDLTLSSTTYVPVPDNTNSEDKIDSKKNQPRPNDDVIYMVLSIFAAVIAIVVALLIHIIIRIRPTLKTEPLIPQETPPVTADDSDASNPADPFPFEHLPCEDQNREMELEFDDNNCVELKNPMHDIM